MGRGRRFLRIASKRSKELGEDQVSHMPMLDPVSGGGEEGSLRGLANGRSRSPRKGSGESNSNLNPVSRGGEEDSL